MPYWMRTSPPMRMVALPLALVSPSGAPPALLRRASRSAFNWERIASISIFMLSKDAFIADKSSFAKEGAAQTIAAKAAAALQRKTFIPFSFSLTVSRHPKTNFFLKNFFLFYSFPGTPPGRHIRDFLGPFSGKDFPPTPGNFYRIIGKL